MILKNKNFNFYLILNLVCLLFLNSCKQKALPKKLPNWPKQKKLNYLENQETKINLHVYSSEDTKDFFGDNFNSLYQPLQLNIANNSNKSFILRSEYINYNLIPASEVESLIKSNTSLFVCGLGYPALLYYWPLFPFVVAPMGYEMYKNNKYLSNFLRINTFEQDDKIEILPYSTCDKLLFIKPIELGSSFNIKLYDQSEGRLCNFSLKLLE